MTDHDHGTPAYSFRWLKRSSEYHLRRGDMVQGTRFLEAAQALRDVEVARVVAENPGIDVDGVRAGVERTWGAAPESPKAKALALLDELRDILTSEEAT